MSFRIVDERQPERSLWRCRRFGHAWREIGRRGWSGTTEGCSRWRCSAARWWEDDQHASARLAGLHIDSVSLLAYPPEHNIVLSAHPVEGPSEPSANAARPSVDDEDGEPCPECGHPFGTPPDPLAPTCRYCQVPSPSAASQGSSTTEGDGS